MTLRISEDLAHRIRAHGELTYPHECCGALLGRDAEGAREALELLLLENRQTSSARKRFALTAEDYRRAEQAANERGLELVGWYHSHPDHPALPSEFDREHAWPWYSYVIVSVERGRAGALASWRLADDRGRFEFEPVQVRTVTPEAQEAGIGGNAKWQ
jgi:proteasome lid subunit RPN8/RPN11